MNNLPEIIVNAVYEVSVGVSDQLHGMCSVSRILDERYFYIKRISGMPGLIHKDEAHGDYRIHFGSAFRASMKRIRLPPADEKIDIKFSFDELLGE